MLRIRDTQVRQVERKRQERSVAADLDLLRQAYPEACDPLDDEALRNRVLALREKAAGYGITLEGNLTRFVAVALHLDDDDFDQRDWAAIMLAWDADENLRLSALEKRLRDEASHPA